MPLMELEERFGLDAVDDEKRGKRCQDCRFVAYDMDGNYCGHERSMEESRPFGQGLRLARSEQGVCKPRGDLWEGRS